MRAPACFDRPTACIACPVNTPQPATYSFTLSEWLLVAPACVLLFVWPLPGTIALRLALTLLLLVIALLQCPKSGIYKSFFADRVLWLTFLVLSAWIVIQALLFGVRTQEALQEFFAQWVRSGLTGLIGFLVAALVTRRQPERSGPLLAMAMTLTLAFQIGLHDVDTLWRWWHEGQLPFQETRIVENRTGISLLTNLLMAILCSEVMARKLYNRTYLPLSRAWLGLLFVICVFATYVAGTRYGSIGFIALIASCVLVALIDKRRSLKMPRLLVIGCVSFVIIGVLGWMFIKSDPRWLTLTDTIPLALDTEHQRAWRDSSQPYPPLPSGVPAEESAYLRLAWAKEAVSAIIRHPLGVGYARNAFGHAMELVYPDYASSKHCHSGVLNFTLGAGIPALLLWLAFVGILAVKGWKSFSRYENPAGLFLLFVVSGFFIRSLVDGNFQDHMFEQFMFLALMFNVLACQNLRSPSGGSESGRDG